MGPRDGAKGEGPVTHVKKILDVLRNAYADREGRPHVLNDVQLATYLDALAEYSSDELETAARSWIRAQKFFPRVSELLAVLTGPPPDWELLANRAWLEVESAIGRAGIYRGVLFEDFAIGETTRLVFGSWQSACNYDRDSPGWAIRRQMFLSQFPEVARRGAGPMVLLRGLNVNDKPYRVKHLEMLPPPKYRDSLSDGAKQMLAEIQTRFLKQKTEGGH